MLIDFRERGKEEEREGDTNVREKHQLVASHTCPAPGTKPTTQACALTGNQKLTLGSMGPRSNQLSHTGQGR